MGIGPTVEQMAASARTDECALPRRSSEEELQECSLEGLCRSATTAIGAAGEDPRPLKILTPRGHGMRA